MKTRLLLLLVFVAATFGQSTTNRRYFVYRKVTGTVNRISYKQPASGARKIELAYAWFKCSVACTWTVYKNGTVTGGSNGTINSLDDSAPTNVSTLTLDGTLAGTTTVNSETFTGANDRATGGGLKLSVDSGTQKMITLEITSSGSGDLTVYGEINEPS